MPLLLQLWLREKDRHFIEFFGNINDKIDVTAISIHWAIVVSIEGPWTPEAIIGSHLYFG